LDDVDWRAGELTIHGKGGRRDRLPLPVRRRRGIGGLPPRCAAGMRLTHSGRLATGASPGDHGDRGPVGRPPRLRTRGTRPDRRPSASPHPGQRSTRRGRVPAGDRAGAAPQGHYDDSDLCKGRPGGACLLGPALAAARGRTGSMSPLRQAAEEYLALRRALGFNLETQCRLLLSFVDYLDRAGAVLITTDLAGAWAHLPPDAPPVWIGLRLSP